MVERIIGIDPGSRYTGIGVIDKNGNRLRFVYSETVCAARIDRMEDRLRLISDRIMAVTEAYQPESAAIEKVFHSVNAKTSLILGQVRGAVLLTLVKADIEIHEYSPNEIKSALVGAGKAGKRQVAAMVKIILNPKAGHQMKEDETDALAVAICHANTIDMTRKALGSE